MSNPFSLPFFARGIRRQTVSMSVGVGFATGLYGLSFGALATASGLSIWQAQVLSLFMFSGGSQFAMIGVLGASGAAGMVPAILSAWLLGIRNGFYALRLSGVLQVVGATKLLTAQLTIDESNAVSLAQEDLKHQKAGFWLTGAAVFVFWNGFTFLGALLGGSVSSPGVWGLDAAASAAFLGLLWPRLTHLQPLAIGICSSVLAAVLLGPLPSGIPVIVAAPLAVLLVWTTKKLFGKRVVSDSDGGAGDAG
jgi:predicted branched-subunit amino acid permease